MSKFILSWLIFLSAIEQANGKVRRISDHAMDISKPHIIYMTSGRSTLLDFPCEISHSVLGLTGDIKAIIGPDNKKTMTLWISGEDSSPTNLTVKCSDEVYVFDIYPNRSNHQDYINIVDSFDGRDNKKRVLLSSSEKFVNMKNKKRKLIVSSKIENSRINLGNNRILQILNKNNKKRVLLKTGVTR